MSDSGGAPPDWYPDPYGRHEKRYYDGSAWTDRVSSHGRESVDAAMGGTNVPTVNRSSEKIRRRRGQGRSRIRPAAVGAGRSSPSRSWW